MVSRKSHGSSWQRMESKQIIKHRNLTATSNNLIVIVKRCSRRTSSCHGGHFRINRQGICRRRGHKKRMCRERSRTMQYYADHENTAPPIEKRETKHEDLEPKRNGRDRKRDYKSILNSDKYAPSSRTERARNNPVNKVVSMPMTPGNSKEVGSNNCMHGVPKKGRRAGHNNRIHEEWNWSHLLVRAAIAAHTPMN